jgi:hypothetical protein
VTLYGNTFSEAFDQVGFSRRLGGIHFKPADLAGRRIGRIVVRQAWAKAANLSYGHNLGREKTEYHELFDQLGGTLGLQDGQLHRALWMVIRLHKSQCRPISHKVLICSSLPVLKKSYA